MFGEKLKKHLITGESRSVSPSLEMAFPVSPVTGEKICDDFTPWGPEKCLLSFFSERTIALYEALGGTLFRYTLAHCPAKKCFAIVHKTANTSGKPVCSIL